MLWAGQEGCARDGEKPIPLLPSFPACASHPCHPSQTFSSLDSRDGELDALIGELTFVQSQKPQVGPDPKPPALN